MSWEVLTAIASRVEAKYRALGDTEPLAWVQVCQDGSWSVVVQRDIPGHAETKEIGGKGVTALMEYYSTLK